MRKSPQQQRSREMVERVINAGRTVLIREGYAAFSTNRVADEAGVSPGSLYQYFPDKAAIVDVIVDRYWTEVVDRIGPILRSGHPGGNATMLAGAVDTLIATLAQDSELLRMIVEELPSVPHKARRAALELRVRDLVSAYLVFVLHMPVAVAERRAWLLVLTAESLVIRWVLDGPRIERGAFAAELVTLLETYLDHQVLDGGRREAQP